MCAIGKNVNLSPDHGVPLQAHFCFCGHGACTDNTEIKYCGKKSRC
jgi:hypothetical protein